MAVGAGIQTQVYVTPNTEGLPSIMDWKYSVNNFEDFWKNFKNFISFHCHNPRK